MSIKRILVNTIDTDLEYEVIGIDLAKNCVSAILLTTDGEIFGIDRLDYQELEKSAQELSPTIFAMEPCTEMNYMVQIKSNILIFLLRFDFGVACLRLYEHQGILNIENNLQDLEKFFLEISRFLLPI